MDKAVAFFHRATRSFETHEVPLPTGFNSSVVGSRATRARFASRHGFTHWIEEHSYRDHESQQQVTNWNVFEVGIDSRILVSTQPTKDAAEMWLVHSA